MTARPERIELSKQALRNRAALFAKKHAGDTSESSERQIFWNDLLGIFGREVKEVGRFEEAAKRLSTGNRGWIDLLVPGDMAVEHKSGGEDLNAAMGQLFDYLDSLQPAAAPWLLVACDFQNFYWQDLRARTEGKFTLEELPAHVELFWWLAGHQESSEFIDEEEANLVATGYMAKLHDAVLASGYDQHALREWLTRILFCLFADDTDVWEKDAFKHFLFLNTRPDGSDLGSTLAYLFQILDMSPEKRPAKLDDDLAVFTYINGDLFANTLPIPTCDEATRTALLEACKFDWSAISPAIFGSMFQNVMTPAERRHLGAHYTTEENIFKTIRPLFLDELEAELDSLRTTATAASRAALNAFHKKLASLRFLDPACGCGNFLVIAYREIRRLETEVLRRLNTASKRDGVLVLDVSHLLRVTVGQFYGIELEEFPARIASTALYLMDHKANREFSSEFGEYFARFPIPTSPHIRIDNALRIDWNDVLPAKHASYVFGNPPFIGMTLMSTAQQEDNRLTFHTRVTTDLRTGRLDYVACWYQKTIDYVGRRQIKCAMVSTNSLFQGEQARTMGPLLSRAGFEIVFAHTTFKWASEAQGTANVHVIIIGFSPVESSRPKRLFEYDTPTGQPTEHRATNINCFLVDGPNIEIAKHVRPLARVPEMLKGSQPTDDGGLIVEANDYAMVMSDPLAAKYVRPFISAKEMLSNQPRWCLWLVDAAPHDLRLSPVLQERLAHVAHWRATVSKTPSVQILAKTPALFTQRRQPTKMWLCVPRHSSADRRVIPMAMFGPGEIAADSVLAVDGAEPWLFALLQSSLYTAWVHTVGGRLKSDIRMSPDIAYNAFPFPDLTDDVKSHLTRAADAILAARNSFPTASLADLYDPLAMPEVLSRAHDELDRVVAACYGSRRRLEADADRLTLLFERYEKLTSPLLSADVEKPQRARREVS
ncbi:MAG: class I SAM-dependent DNA methyltransferase [Acidobacteria bacterium]|nr:class I SAM-dependent DNA methyltransferase [Acidobacteriota bacterium]